MKKYLHTFILLFCLFVLANCAVRTYPRPVTPEEKFLSNLAFHLDNLSAAYVRHFVTGERPGYDLSRQRVQLKNYMFYADPAFYADPHKFYLQPEGIPKVTTEVLADKKDYTILLLTWPSQYSPRNPEFIPLYESYVEDHTAYAVMYKAKKKSKGALIVLHGWTGGDVVGQAKGARLEQYVALGYDAVLLQHPYHGKRMPAGEVFSGEYFLSGEVSRLNEAMCQAVTDARSLLNYLRQDHEVVGVWGGSLGGITTLNFAMVERGLDFAIAVVPPSSFGDLPEDNKVAPFVVKGMHASGLDVDTVKKVLYVSSPMNYKPDIPLENILIIAGMGDNFVPPNQPLMVWEAWGRPEIHWYPGGHVFHFHSDQERAVTYDFLMYQLNRERKK